MKAYFRYVLFLISTVQLFFAFAYIFKLDFAIALWPLPKPDSLAFFFIGSIFAAAAASTFWCAASEEYGALAGIALDYITIFIPLTILAWQLDGGLSLFTIACGAGVVFGIGLFLWSRRIPIPDSPPMPLLVRGSFVGFMIALIIVGGLLILQNNILPWRADPEAVVLYGWVFLGAAVYFAYGVFRPSWRNAAGQLVGFLAYDLVLIGPFLAQLPTIEAELRRSLIIYTLVVIYSGLLAIYYLFIHEQTRLRLNLPDRVTAVLPWLARQRDTS